MVLLMDFRIGVVAGVENVCTAGAVNRVAVCMHLEEILGHSRHSCVELVGRFVRCSFVASFSVVGREEHLLVMLDLVFRVEVESSRLARIIDDTDSK